MKKISFCVIVIAFSLSLGCNKDDVLNTNSSNRLKSSGGQNLTSLEKDLSSYIEIPDYLPSSIEAIRAERTELLMAVDSNTPYRNRTLSETMFLYEAAVNLDINHMPIPLKKFRKEISVFNITKAEDGKISAASIKGGINSIVSKLSEIGHAHRFVGSIDVEPIQDLGNDVRLRVVYNTGEPYNGFPDENYQRPYGDDNFLQLGRFGKEGVACSNPIPEENAADDLSGVLYNGGNFGAWVQNNATQYFTFINNQWVFTGYDNWDPVKKLYYGIHIPGLYSSYLWTHVNVHTFHWSLNRSYADFWDMSWGSFGGINLPTNPNNSSLSFVITIPELHGRLTTHLISTLNCSDHYDLDPGNSGSVTFNKTPGIFFRTKVNPSPGAGHMQIANCFSFCQFEDHVDSYWDHVKSSSILSKLPAHPKNSQIVGMEVLPAHLKEEKYKVCVAWGYDMKGSWGCIEYKDYSPLSIEHFLFPSYGDRVEFGPYF
jgi:hypothetical protein